MPSEIRTRWGAYHTSDQVYPGDEDRERAYQTRGWLDRFDRLWAARHRKSRDYPMWWYRRPDGDIVLVHTDPDSEKIYRAKNMEPLNKSEAINYVRNYGERTRQQRRHAREVDVLRKSEDGDAMLKLLANMFVTMGITNPGAVYDSLVQTTISREESDETSEDSLSASLSVGDSIISPKGVRYSLESGAVHPEDENSDA